MLQKIVKVATTVLDASGNGVASLTPDGGDWKVTITSVSVNSSTSEPTANLYLNTVGDVGFIEGTYSGSSDSSDTSYVVSLGEVLYCQWTGGDPGATATLRITGWAGSAQEVQG